MPQQQPDDLWARLPPTTSTVSGTYLQEQIDEDQKRGHRKKYSQKKETNGVSPETMQTYPPRKGPAHG